MKNNVFHQLENEFPLARIRSVFKKWFPLISVTVLASRKELSSRWFPLKRKSLSNSWNEEFIKKYVSTRRKKRLWFILARKSVFTTWNEAFVEKYVSNMQKKCFFRQKNGKWFPLRGKYFSVKTDSLKFQSWFLTAEKKLQTKTYCFHQTENKFPLAEMKDLLKYIFLLDNTGKCIFRYWTNKLWYSTRIYLRTTPLPNTP